MNNSSQTLPGCEGEHILQDKYKTQENAKRFYDKEVYAHITDVMLDFIKKQTMLFIATADKNGESDSSFRGGGEGFVRVLSTKRLIYPEFNGNGVMASLGNISENGHIGMLFIDFFDTLTGLHVNGKAEIVDKQELSTKLTKEEYITLQQTMNLHTQEQITWVLVDVEEAYIHCSKNIPELQKRK
ncbi:pyridoxamine 5'-phosphate oxidase family protein [Sulfurimonas sp. SAG-AH-194-C20]|nr:pyridoxamine 5'-phosphate oxidase family protein [Sulfurimonas sp. SAG-AH-194-C20]MDF1879585.1 pyridoxamine 5'-phosphate oxidase family protein [Sulfurimonas sp. SAG-AH-194-C20]